MDLNRQTFLPKSPPPPESQSLLRKHLWLGALRGERTVAVTRAVLAMLVFGQLLVFRALGMYAQNGGILLVGIACAVAVIWSVWSIQGLGVERPLLRWLGFSVFVDVLVAWLCVLAVVIWPFPGYAGLPRYPAAGIFGVIAVAAGVRLSRRVALLGMVLSAAAVLSLAAVDLVLNRAHVTYNPADAVLFAVVFAGAAVLGYNNAARTKKLVFESADAAIAADRARRRLGIYLPEPVAKEALESTSVGPGGRRQHAAVLFSDLRGFTRYAENMPPERLIGELNAYLDAMMTVIRDEGGVVDKVIGDAIMVVFGIPKERPDDAARAIRCALAMQRALAEHNRQRALSKQLPLQQGVGAHFGPVVAGHIGNSERLQFTVIGDAVNVASRLEAATKNLGADILFSADLVDAARRSGGIEDVGPLRSLGRVTMRGREAELEVFTPEAWAAEARMAAGDLITDSGVRRKG